MKIDSSGVALDVQVEGAGRPVVLVHGFPDTKRLWSKQVPPLVDAGYQVITYDQRGYGASDKPAEVEAYSIPFLAIDVTAVLDHLGLERAHLVGHDWGSAVVWATAALAPDRVDHLVAMSVGHPSAFGSAGLAQREKSWYMLLFQFAPQAEQWLTMDDGENFRGWCGHPDFDAVFAEVLRDKSLTPGLSYYRANVTPDALVGPPLELPPIQAPTMGIWSSADFALTEDQMTASAAYCASGFRYERIEGPGHWLQWEAPDPVNRLLIDFLPR
ncbi:MAG: alpha/beta hydrolase [Acidimicrobiales bacterium]